MLFLLVSISPFIVVIWALFAMIEPKLLPFALSLQSQQRFSLGPGVKERPLLPHEQLVGIWVFLDIAVMLPPVTAENRANFKSG